MKIIPKKYYNLAFAFCMAFLMSFIMSGFITLINVGLNNDFLYTWFKAWGGAFMLGLPIAIFIVPLVRKLLDKITY